MLGHLKQCNQCQPSHSGTTAQKFIANKVILYSINYRQTLHYIITISRLFSLRKPSIIYTSAISNIFPTEKHKDIAIELSKCQGNGNRGIVQLHNDYCKTFSPSLSVAVICSGWPWGFISENRLLLKSSSFTSDPG